MLGNLAKLTCRITKLGWFDSADHRDIIEETRKFLQATIEHHIVGLRLLIALVDEMNSPTTGRTLTVHRKTAVSFRDQALLADGVISHQMLMIFKYEADRKEYNQTGPTSSFFKHTNQSKIL